jgi:hypothetical protein
MDYQKKYLEYKMKYHLLKQTGGMPPKAAPAAAAAAAAKETEAVEAVENGLLKMITPEAKAKAQELGLTSELIRTITKIKTPEAKAEARNLKLPSELMDIIIDIDTRDGPDEIIRKIKELLPRRENIYIRNIIDTYLLDNIEQKRFGLEIILEIYRLTEFEYKIKYTYDYLRQKMKKIIIKNILNKSYTIEELVFIYNKMNAHDKSGVYINRDSDDINLEIYEYINEMQIDKLPIYDLINIYDLNSDKILEIINYKINNEFNELPQYFKLFDHIIKTQHPVYYTNKEYYKTLQKHINILYEERINGLLYYGKDAMTDGKILMLEIHFLCEKMLEGNYTIEIDTSRNRPPPNDETLIYSKESTKITDLNDLNKLYNMIIGEIFKHFQQDRKIKQLRLINSSNKNIIYSFNSPLLPPR